MLWLNYKRITQLVMSIDGTSKSMQDVKKYNSDLVESARKLAETTRDPATSKRILDSINELEGFMPMMEVHSATAAKNPSNANAKRQADADVEKCRQLIDQILRDTKAELISTAHKEMNIL
jgi:hypothetical protein